MLITTTSHGVFGDPSLHRRQEESECLLSWEVVHIHNTGALTCLTVRQQLVYHLYTFVLLCNT